MQQSRFSNRASIARISVLVIFLSIALVASFATSSILFLSDQGGSVTSTIIETSTSYATIAKVAYTSTITETENDSLSSIALANITTGDYPESMALNPITNTLYVTYWNGNASLAVIDANTNRIVATIANVPNYPPVVDSGTNMIYVGNEIINGTTNKITAQMNSNLQIVAMDENGGVLYAMNTKYGNGVNATTTLYEINGSTNEIARSQTYAGQYLESAVFDPNSSALFATDCTNFFACAPSYVVEINASNLAMESRLPMNAIFFALAFDPTMNLIFATALQNLLLVINGSNDQLVSKVPVSAYATEYNGLAVDAGSNEILLGGSPSCSDSPGCGLNTLYVVSGIDYGLYAKFVGSDSMNGPIALQFDPVNNETYVAFGFSSYILAVKVPTYHTSFMLP